MGGQAFFFLQFCSKGAQKLNSLRVTYLGNLIQQDGSVHVELCLEWYCSGGDDQFLCMYLFIRVHIYCDFKADSDKAATPTQSSKNQPHFQ